ncbi:head GIN domain-containing protein [Pontibacter pamirensis]|uniref:head GIN domain-containing protein n=1 Tax=Pontibacter pamirensis TaxID=2562824 RepID=UPI001389FE9B|nr:head GIN domain-containing protein [Pontibacter pamirensis]
MKGIQSYTTSLFVFLIALLFTTVPLMAQQLRGNGNIQTQDRNVSDFRGINVSGGFAVEITQGNQESLRLEADENLLSNIKSEVRNGVLHIYNEDGVTTKKGMKAYITMRELSSVDISGGVKVTGNSTFKTDALELDMSGASKVNLDINTDRLEADMSGASKIELTGRADEVDMDMSGASKVEAADLQAKRVKVEASGASKVRVYATETLDISASGATSISYKGSPSITAETSSAAKISKI